jgi:hypothetical protein
LTTLLRYAGFDIVTHELRSISRILLQSSPVSVAAAHTHNLGPGAGGCGTRVAANALHLSSSTPSLLLPPFHPQPASIGQRAAVQGEEGPNAMGIIGSASCPFPHLFQNILAQLNATSKVRARLTAEDHSKS